MQALTVHMDGTPPTPPPNINSNMKSGLKILMERLGGGAGYPVLLLPIIKRHHKKKEWSHIF